MDNKTVKSNYYNDYQSALAEASAEFNDEDHVVVGFNCQRENDALLYQAVISNCDDLMSEADRWNENKLSVIKSELDKVCSYTPAEYYAEYPQCVTS